MIFLFLDVLQNRLDNYCQNTVTKEHKDCEYAIFARFGTDRNGGKNQWRCYKSIKEGKMSKSCIDNHGKLKDCQEPDPAGGKYCTRHTQLNEILVSYEEKEGKEFQKQGKLCFHSDKVEKGFL